MNGRTPTHEESLWLDQCAQTCCIVCDIYHEEKDSPAEIHHTQGCTVDDAHFLILPLCDKHHRVSDTHCPKRWISRHGDGRARFEKRYTNEAELLSWQLDRVDKLGQTMV